MDNIKEILEDIDLNEFLTSLQKGDLPPTVQKIDQKIAGLRAQGEAGAGLVKAEINGHNQVMHVSIDETILTPENKSLVEDLVRAALNIAHKNLKEKISQS